MREAILRHFACLHCVLCRTSLVPDQVVETSTQGFGVIPVMAAKKKWQGELKGGRARHRVILWGAGSISHENGHFFLKRVGMRVDAT
ncbi:hypothetical protein BC940DRAFT_288213 [Gongronella butleri]|nr:hypothetical protein BC940DRAFT_288213 [Gongronella butleri]